MKLLQLLLLLLLLVLAQFQARAAWTWSTNFDYILKPDDPNLSNEIPVTTLSNYDDATAYLVVSGTRSNASMTDKQIAPYLAFVSFDNNQTVFLCIYLISYTLTSDGVIIWTANRDSPIPSQDATISLLGNGDFQLRSGNHSPVWSTNTSTGIVQGMELTAVSPARMILYGSGTDVVWQSADFPTDTLTTNQVLNPGAKLVSWSSKTDPSNGPYSLVMEPGGLALYDKSFSEPQIYWIWGFFGLNDSSSVMHTCKNLINAEVSSYGSLMLSRSLSPSDDSTLCSIQNAPAENTILPFLDYGVSINNAKSDGLFLTLGYDGNLMANVLRDVKWTEELNLFGENICLLPKNCGPYGLCSSLSASACSCPEPNSNIFAPLSPKGCVLVSPFSCPIDPSDTTMIKLPGVNYFSTQYSISSNESTEQSCQENCNQNCSCSAAFWHRLNKTCFKVSGQIGSLQQADEASYTAYLKTMANSSSTAKTSASISQSRKTAVVATTSGIAALIVLACVAFCIYRFSCRGNSEEEDPFLDVIPGLPTRFSYKELQAMTNGFTKMLGRGGFGAVYEGEFADGTKVAVKQLEGIRQGDKEFRSEVGIMGAIHHFNVLRLLGFCAERQHRLLVYECMENGSLDEWLFHGRDVKVRLSWDLRCRIALGAARGLAYLHDDCSEKILHLDVKPQNILLDLDFVPKVADMGLARLVGRAESPQVVTIMRGTPGYLAPEWLKEGSIDEKCDVFSFGMLLMEIVSGRKNLSRDENFYYPEWAYRKVQGVSDQSLTELTNAEIKTKEDCAQLKQMINTAFLCVVDTPASRPSMEEVVQMLEGRVLVSDTRVSNLSRQLHFVRGNVKDSSFPAFELTDSIFSSTVVSFKSSTSTSSNFTGKNSGSRSFDHKHSNAHSGSYKKELSLSTMRGR